MILSHTAQSSLARLYAAFLVAKGALCIAIKLVREMSRPCAAFIHIITIKNNESLYDIIGYNTSHLFQ
jgi:hypothetical protein